MRARADRDVDYLVASLRDPEFRDLAATTLGQIGAREATPTLLPLLDASDQFIRIAAARALGRLRAVQGLPRLLELAEADPLPVVRSWALFAAVMIGGDTVRTRLLTLIDSPEPSTRALALAGLLRLGDPIDVADARQHVRRLGWRQRREVRRVGRKLAQRTS